MLYNNLLSFLTKHQSDEEIVALFQRVRINQSNGLQIKLAIVHSLQSFANDVNFVPQPSTLKNDNTVYFLMNKYRAAILQFRFEGYGYGAIAKMLAKRGGYNKETGKAFSRATIQRVCNLLEKKETSS